MENNQNMHTFPPQWLDSPGWALAFSRSLFPASLLPSSDLQFLVLKTRRSSSRPSVHLRFGLSFLRVANWLSIAVFLSGAIFIRSGNLAYPFN
ncbi:hypothetical protein TNCV_2616431 [Trichonephila clavipes]|nr:hypothetical protein TNCV_2616431 [Trichonephila clavipes]